MPKDTIALRSAQRCFDGSSIPSSRPIPGSCPHPSGHHSVSSSGPDAGVADETLVPQPVTGSRRHRLDACMLADGYVVHAHAGAVCSIGTSLALAENSDGSAIYATDFQPDPSALLRILVVDRSLDPDRAGALAQRVIEIETYRTLALLGLPEAQRLAPSISTVEQRLAEVTDQNAQGRRSRR